MLHPRRFFRSLLALPPQRRSSAGAASVLALGALYSGTVALLQAGGAQPVARPWLPIPRDRYYAWFRLLTVPSFLAIWLAFSAAATAAARCLGAVADAADTRAIAGPSLALPVFVTMWVPETIMGLLLVSGAVEWEPMRDWGARRPGIFVHNVRQVGGGAWALALGAIAIQEAHRLPPSKAMLSSAAGMLAAGAVVAVLIR